MLQIKSPIIGITWLLTATMCFFACEEEKNARTAPGYVYLSVEQDKTLLTKAEIPVTNEVLSVDFINAEKDTVKSYTDFTTEVKDEKIVLPAGIYTVAVHSSGDKEASWETPFYAGKEEVEVKAGEISTAKVVCKITNTKVSVVYSQSIKDHFINYETNVSNSSGSLLYTRDEYRSGYFAPEKLTAMLSLTNKDGNTFLLQRVFPDIKERYHYTLKFTAADDGDKDQAGGNFDIEVDEENKVIEYNIYISMEDDLFGKGVPVLTLNGFAADNTVTFKKTSHPVIPSTSLRIQSANGIERLGVVAESSLMKAYGLTTFDLAKLSSEQTANLNIVHFPLLPADVNMKDITLNFDALAAILPTEGALLPGTHRFTIYAMDKLHQEQQISFTYTVRPDVPAFTGQPDVWATFATLKGNASEDNRAFYLKKEADNESAWKKIEPTTIDQTSGDFSVLMTDLSPNTAYQYYVTAGTDSRGETVTFTTDPTPIVPNLSFDSWVSANGTVYPNADLNSNYFWDSGNGGAKSAKKTPTEETSDAVKGSAVYMHSEMATVIGIGAFAAGNIYTGQFIRAITSDLSNPGAELDFGRPYTGRPTRMRGYYKYSPGTIDQAKGKYAAMQGKQDMCALYIALCDWTGPFRANTQQSKFVDLTDKSILAYGELDLASCSKTVSEYTKFEIDIKYRDTSRKPTYILIVASASKYGDYFTGSTSSKMYLDELELDFSYNPNSFTNE